MKVIVLKNIILHILLVPFYIYALREIALMPVSKLDTLLLFVGLIVIAPITSNFIFSYKDARNKRCLLWGHITTFFSTIVIGMLFITLDILLVLMIGNVLIFRISIILFWLGVITFDFADFYEANKSIVEQDDVEDFL